MSSVRHVDAYAIVLGLAKMYGLTISPATIRSWANRGHIQRHGRSHDGKALYDWGEVQRHALARPETEARPPSVPSKLSGSGKKRPAAKDYTPSGFNWDRLGARARGMGVGYDGVHHRVRKVWGKADEHPCDACGEQAAHWAYDHRDPDEVVDHRGFPYSREIDHYWPLCRSCHREFDKAHADAKRVELPSP